MKQERESDVCQFHQLATHHRKVHTVTKSISIVDGIERKVNFHGIYRLVFRYCGAWLYFVVKEDIDEHKFSRTISDSRRDR